jgi:hypothetical protein
MGRVAKLMAETLTLVQNGECRAHNINPKDFEGGYVIERDNDED